VRHQAEDLCLALAKAEEKPEKRDLRLKESKVVGDGVLVLIYERAADRG
jgi:hypothetical protein